MDCNCEELQGLHNPKPVLYFPVILRFKTKIFKDEMINIGFTWYYPYCRLEEKFQQKNDTAGVKIVTSVFAGVSVVTSVLFPPCIFCGIEQNIIITNRHDWANLPLH